MKRILDIALPTMVIACVALAWTSEYGIPQTRVLRATMACMGDDSTVQKVASCTKAAQEQHGSWLTKALSN